MLPLQGAQVQFPVGELRSHTTHNVAKIKPKKSPPPHAHIHKTQGMYTVFYNNYKWSITFKNWELSLQLSLHQPLVVQWLRICLPMPGTCVRSLLQEDPVNRGATEPVSQATELMHPEPVLHNKRSHRNACSPQLGKPAKQQRPSTAKNKSVNLL